MNRRISIQAFTAYFAVLALVGSVFAMPSTSRDGAVQQISGVGAYAAPGECTDPEGDGSDYVLLMTGSISGCDYTFVESARCSAGGAYFETGTETFVGTLDGEFGTFRTQYVFTATYRDCPSFVGEIAGRCEHPIVAGSGTGVFEGVKGRFDMRDDVEEGNFPYRGHLSF